MWWELSWGNRGKRTQKGFPAKRNQREPMIGKPEPKAKLEGTERWSQRLSFEGTDKASPKGKRSDKLSFSVKWRLKWGNRIESRNANVNEASEAKLNVLKLSSIYANIKAKHSILGRAPILRTASEAFTKGKRYNTELGRAPMKSVRTRLSYVQGYIHVRPMLNVFKHEAIRWMSDKWNNNNVVRE